MRVPVFLGHPVYTYELVLVCEIQNSVNVILTQQNVLQQSVSSKRNLLVVEKSRKTCELFLCSKNKRGRVAVQIACIPFFVRWFTWNLFL